MIEKLGGKLTGTANKASLCISTKSALNLVCKAGTRHASCEGSEVEGGEALSAAWHPQDAPRWVSSLVSSVVWVVCEGRPAPVFACCSVVCGRVPSIPSRRLPAAVLNQPELLPLETPMALHVRNLGGCGQAQGSAGPQSWGRAARRGRSFRTGRRACFADRWKPVE